MKKYLWVLAYLVILAFCILSSCTIRPDATPASTPSPDPTIHPPVITEIPSWAEDIRPTIIDPTPNSWPTDEPVVEDEPEDIIKELLQHELISYNDLEHGYQVVLSQPATENQRILYRSNEFDITAYCGCEICCGDYSVGRPTDEYGDIIVYGALGIRLYGNTACAVDPNIIPFRSNVYIDGRCLYAYDRGPDGLHVDIYRTTHQEALLDPSNNINHTGFVRWCDKDTHFTQYELDIIEQQLQDGNYVDLNSMNLTIDDILFYINMEESK